MRTGAKSSIFSSLRSGILRGKRVGLLSLAFLLALPLLPTLQSATRARADYSRPIDVISIAWPGSTTLTTTVQAVRAGITSYAVPYWKREANIEFTQGMDQFAPLSMSSNLPCNGDATVDYMNAVAKKFYLSQGLTPGTRYLVILAPKIPGNCVWAAKTIIGDYRIPYGITVLQDNAMPYVMTHELGHTLGLGHTNLMNCPSPGDNDWSACKNVEYGGAIDMMGNIDTGGSLNIYHKWRSGALQASDIQAITHSGTYTINAISSGSGTRGLFIHDGGAIYWIEYRRAHGTYKAGLYIYRTDTPTNAGSTSSINPEYSGRYIGDTSGDVWLLNLDNYSYSSKATGSPSAFSFTTHSGNVELNASEINGQLAVDATVAAGASLEDLPTTPPNLNKYNFAAPDFGSLYQVSPVVDGTSLSDPTLQICSAKYASESHRVQRSQVQVTPLYKMKYNFISSEAVQYESSFWASQTLKELTAAISKCPSNNGQIRVLSYKAPQNLSAISLIVTTKNKGVTQNLLATFQVKAKMLIGVYVLSPTTFNAVEITHWQNMALKIGKRI